MFYKASDYANFICIYMIRGENKKYLICCFLVENILKLNLLLGIIENVKIAKKSITN
jgi:hypothetical protein